MNELIKQLAIKAGFDIYTFNENELEKFAQLIVEECAKCCDALQKYPATEPRHCASDIRITFGVPE